MKKKHNYPFQLREALRKKNVKKAAALLTERPGLHKLRDPATGSELIALAFASGNNAMIAVFVAAQQAHLATQLAASMQSAQPAAISTSVVVTAPATVAVPASVPLTVAATATSPAVSKI